MRNFLKKNLRSLGTYLGLEGVLTRPSFIVGFPQMVILITYGMKYFTMEAVSVVCTFAQDRSSSTMWCCAQRGEIESTSQYMFFFENTGMSIRNTDVPM